MLEGTQHAPTPMPRPQLQRHEIQRFTNTGHHDIGWWMGMLGMDGVLGFGNRGARHRGEEGVG
ncbi:MAG: hypothetical protein H6658_16495 [Ardenticatenaceae bacterium]|nr:hypothetical protein [Ardenticatenaceae bacterium]